MVLETVSSEQELCAESPKKKTRKTRETKTSVTQYFPIVRMTHPRLHHVEEHAQGFPNMYDTLG